jgi:Holliday junction resolvasome RuvABC ATP-dependent DNA helicase subunit
MHQEIEKCFESVRGQSRIVSRLKQAASNFAHGGELTSVLFEGLAGLGKTKLFHAYLDALNIAYAIRQKEESPENIRQCLRYFSLERIRRTGSEYSNLLDAILEMRPLFLGFDEISDFAKRPTVQTDKIHTFIKETLDENGYGRERKKMVLLTQGEESLPICVSRHNLCIVAATNHPEKMLDKDAMRSRFTRLVLDLLDEDTLTQILMDMLEAKGIRANENTIGMVARTGRGTARPLEDILKYFDELIRSNEKPTRTINYGEAVGALRILQLYPQGLDVKEVGIVKRCVGEGYRLASLSLMFGLEQEAVRKSIAYLQSKNLVGIKGSNIVTAGKGMRYLEELTKDKFVIP